MSDQNYKSFGKVHEDPLLENNDSSNDIICENRLNRINPKYTISFCCATWGFLTAVERAIILPTLWLYLVTKFQNEAASAYYGLTLGAFNLTLFIFAPLYGYLAFKGYRTKLLLVISNQLEVIGNIIYFAASAPWMVLMGRFIAGLGAGSEVPLYADVVRVIQPSERTSYIIILLLIRQIGLILGPAATLILQPLKFYVGSIPVNIYNSPGFLMAILWCVHTVQVLVSYPNIDKSGALVKSHPSKKKICERLIYQIHEKQSDSDSGMSHTAESPRRKVKPKPTMSETTKHFANELSNYAKYDTLTLLITLFGAYVALMAIEAVIPPVCEKFFKWNEVHISYLYLMAGVLVIMVFAILQSLSRCVKDRTMLLVGLILLTISYTSMTVVMFFINSQEKNRYISLICVGILFHIFGLSLVVACGESLYTKILEPEEMDLAQSVLRTTMNLSLLIGPYVGGSLYMYPYIVFIVLSILIIVSLLLLVLRYSWFDY